MVFLPDLLVSQKQFFGLSIERLSIHAVEIDAKGKPIHFAESQISEDIFVDGVLTKPEVIVNSIQSVLKNSKISTPYVAVTFPEVFAYTRGYTLPIIPISELQEAISWHAKELFPFPEEEIYFDWKILNKTEKDYQTTVVAVQKKILDPIIQVLITAGLKPLRFEPDASALSRLLKLHHDQDAILIEINPNGAYITLVEGEKALFTTVVPYTTGDTAESYLKNIDQTLQEIATFYKNKGIISDSSTQVVTTGVLASDDWASHFQDLLHYPAIILQTPLGNAAYNKAYAAAIQEIAPPLDEQSINLLPIEIQLSYDSEHDNQLYKNLLVRMCILMVIVCIGSFFSYFYISIENQLTDSKVKSIRKFTQSQQSDTQSLLLLNAQARNIVTLAPLRTTPLQKLQAFQKILTDKIIITQWEYDDSKLQFKISGIATTREALLTFKDSIDKSKVFTNVTLPLETLETPVQVPFTLSCIIK